MRAASTERNHRAAMAPRRRVSRLRAHRGDVLRDAQRLPRSRAGRADRRPPRRGVLLGRPVIRALLELPSHVRARLASALDAGVITAPASAAALRTVLGPGGEVDSAV